MVMCQYAVIICQISTIFVDSLLVLPVLSAGQVNFCSFHYFFFNLLSNLQSILVTIIALKYCCISLLIIR